MDANGTRFHLLLGQADWDRCVADAEVVEWDRRHAELTLKARGEKFRAAPADTPARIEERRGVGADRFGNIYWIDATRTRVLVRSAGSGEVSEFWPSDLNLPSPEHGDFADDTTPAPAVRRLAGVAVTEDHYLVVGMGEPAGLLVFDLVAGGPPIDIRWPAMAGAPPFAPLDLAARPGCGVWILDSARRYWALDAGFGVVTANQGEIALAPREVADFQPVAGGATRESAPVVFPRGNLLDAWSPAVASNPIAIEGLAGGEVLILDAGEGDANSRVACCREGRAIAIVDLDFRAHDFVFIPADNTDGKADGTTAGRLLIASVGGNQAFAYDLVLDASGLRLTASTDFFPMRRFAGRGLVLVPTLPGKPQVFYDFGESWVPLVRQRRVRYEEEAEIVTPVFDSTELDCVWHRLMLDACIPPGASVEVWSRAGNERDGASIAAGWRKEPRPYLRGTGSELAWAGTWPGRPAKNKSTADGEGTWELLFQHARGRYAQLKLVLQGDGRSTPRLRALRAWYPRFSFVKSYLPAVYREDADSASFFERFLANFEGTWTAIEDRVAAVQALFDVRSVPADALAWLADWFGVALDPAWDERRRRLFIRHAMDFFQYRGTIHGLRMALHLAFDECIDESDLGPPESERKALGAIRIVENYLLRGAPSVVFGEPEEVAGPRLATSTALWSPAEGNAGLVRRYRESLGEVDAKPEGEAIAFSLAPGNDTGWQSEWEKRKAFLQGALGTVPTGGTEERKRWQQYLESRHDSIAALNTRHGASYASFSSIPLPADEPAQAKRSEDWRAFITHTAGTRETAGRSRWQDFLAQRYRRVESLNARHGTKWSSFAWIALPDVLPADGVALDDWLQFELRAEPIYALAHSFRVLLPTPAGGLQPALAKERMDLAQRIVDLEKPAHTVFDVRFFWSLFRIGDARLGFDTLMDQGSRAPQLLPDTVLGRSFMGTSFVAPAGANSGPGRLALVC